MINAVIVSYLNYHGIYHTITIYTINNLIINLLPLSHNNTYPYSSAYSVRYFALKAFRN